MAPQRKFETHGPHRLAERQAGRWALQRGADRGAAQPCVAISRLPGAGGAEVGRRVAEWLDYGFFGREIVDEVAKDLGVDHWVVEGLDERVRSAIDRYVADAFRKDQLRESDYLRAVARTISTLGRRGAAVLVGRGAPFILEPEHALRVLVVAPRDFRIQRFGDVHGLVGAEAEKALSLEETRRAEFATAQFGVSHDDPLLYDLTVNTGTLSFAAAAGVVIDALRRRFNT